MVIAVTRLRGGGPSTIYSHAHGGRTFRLERARSRLQLARGQQPRVLDAVLEVTRLQGELFDFGGDRPPAWRVWWAIARCRRAPSG